MTQFNDQLPGGLPVPSVKVPRSGFKSRQAWIFSGFFFYDLLSISKLPCTFVLTASDKAKQAWGRETGGEKENVWHFARCGKWFLFAFYMLMSRTFYFTIDLSWEKHFLVASVKQPLPMAHCPSMARRPCRDREACHWKKCLMKGIFSLLFWTSSAKINDAVL